MIKINSEFAAISDFLVKSVNVRTIILFGSTARDEAIRCSDIDLLLITEQKISKREVKRLIPKSLMPSKKLSLSVYSVEQIHSAYEGGSLFLAHILKEGKVLYDDGFFKELSSSPFFISCSRMRLSLRIFEQRLEIANNLEMYDKHFVRLFSDFYSMAKGIAFMILANNGQYVFNRKEAFDMLSNKYPDYKQTIKKLQALEPFFIKTHRGVSERLPFDPAVSEEKLEEMKTNLKELITLGESEIVC